jgi:hypothetical protein
VNRDHDEIASGSTGNGERMLHILFYLKVIEFQKKVVLAFFILLRSATFFTVKKNRKQSTLTIM